MRAFRFTLFSSLISFALLSSVSYAAAFQFYELGTPIIGTADVGQAAVANDASTSYYNPAGMAVLNGSQFMIGSGMIAPYANFRKNHFNTIPGDNGDNAATLTPMADVYLVYCLTPNLKLGVSLTSPPYGGLLNFNDGWVGRYSVQFSQFYTVDLNPSFSYRINQWVSFGAGVTAEYANLHQVVALPVPTSPLIDGQITVRVDDLSAGYNFGMLFQPTETTKIGIAYRSKIHHDLKGHLSFLRLPFVPSAKTQMTMPQNVIASIVQDVTPCFSVLGEAGWSNWASMRDNILNVDNFSVSTPMRWKDTYRVGLGAQYHVNPLIMLQTGASYDSSPTNTRRRQPVLPMDRQIRVGAGAVLSLPQGAQIGFSYEYINFGKAKIDNTTRIGRLDGDFSRNYANVLQVSINVDC